MSGRLLLDTHALLWWMADDAQLSPRIRDRIALPEEEVFVSAASVWEIAIKARKGKLHGVGPYLEQQAKLHADWGFVPVAIGPEDAVMAGSIALPHGDPFDRVLIVQARRLDADLATCDRAIADHCERAVWA
jgi:PIN domain nuclease of toxin-antitoxin system